MNGGYELISSEDNETKNNKSNEIELSNINDCERGEYNDDCSVCLKINDETSQELSCGCKKKFHIKCINKLKRHNTEKCPLCKSSVRLSNDTPNTPCDCCFGFFMVGIILIFFASLFSLIYGVGSIMTYYNNDSPFNFCDNID